jgi:hypothetical protein
MTAMRRTFHHLCLVFGTSAACLLGASAAGQDEVQKVVLLVKIKHRMKGQLISCLM